MDSSNLADITSEGLSGSWAFVADLQRALHVRRVSRADGEWTQVTIDRLLITHPGPAGRARIVVCTELRVRLSSSLFAPALAVKINTASEEKGRVIYAVDIESNEVIAAASYHLPTARARRIEVTALAARTDDPLARLGRACIPILKCCIHEISAHELVDRGGQVALWASGESAKAAVTDYGFRPGPAPRQARVSKKQRVSQSAGPSGSVFLVQDAPELRSP